MSVVIDASLTMTWYFEEEATPATEALLDVVVQKGAVVPPLWRIEVSNAFQSGIRRRRIEIPYRDASLGDLGRLPIVVDGEADAHVWFATLRLSDRHGLTVYDACYLELALRRNLPLATLDHELRKAARDLGVSLLGV